MPQVSAIFHRTHSCFVCTQLAQRHTRATKSLARSTSSRSIGPGRRLFCHQGWNTCCGLTSLPRVPEYWSFDTNTACILCVHISLRGWQTPWSVCRRHAFRTLNVVPEQQQSLYCSTSTYATHLPLSLPDDVRSSNVNHTTDERSISQVGGHDPGVTHPSTRVPGNWDSTDIRDESPRLAPGTYVEQQASPFIYCKRGVPSGYICSLNIFRLQNPERAR